VTQLTNGRAIGITIAVLVGYDIARSTLVPGTIHFATNTGLIVVIAAVAAAARLTAEEVGLARDALPAGVRMGSLAVLVVGVVVAVGVALVGGDSPFVDDHVGRPLDDVLVQVVLEIPVATVLLEELAFRGVLAALLHRVLSPARAVAVTSLLFGLWHVPGAWAGFDLSGVVAVLTVVAATTVAGVVFQLMKDRTRSLVAPGLAHWATNGLSLLIVWAVVGGG
jgi:membrane protease YdiL (CAAX protease family)